MKPSTFSRKFTFSMKCFATTVIYSLCVVCVCGGGGGINYQPLINVQIRSRIALAVL